jgi:hypothetical protein
LRVAFGYNPSTAGWGYFMALQVIEIMPGKFLYRCDACSFEYPKDPVPKQELGIPPRHNCPNGNRLDVEEIMDRQDKD